MQLICPLCHELLSREQQRWCCSNNHSFDIAREGYTHLLPVQKKKSRAPGDDKMMVNARSSFLNGGYYQSFSDALNQQVLHCLQQQHNTAPAIIDAGCGEGYYSSRLQQSLIQQAIDTDITGVDISKWACRAAAKRNPHTQWLVASSSDIPVADDSADIILCLFAPIQSEEFERCLKDSGQLIIASTGPQHLLELREILYDKVDTTSLNTDASVEQHFTPLAAQPQSVSQLIKLEGSDDIMDLLAMTPHYWRAPKQRKQQLSQLETLSVSLDIQLHCYQKKSGLATL